MNQLLNNVEKVVVKYFSENPGTSTSTGTCNSDQIWKQQCVQTYVPVLAKEGWGNKEIIDVRPESSGISRNCFLTDIV